MVRRCWYGAGLVVLIMWTWRRGTRILATEGIALPGLEPRGALRLTLARSGADPFVLIAAHLGLRRTDRRAQWARIARELGRGGPGPRVCAGLLARGAKDEKS